jgi:hypothetical protein
MGLPTGYIVPPVSHAATMTFCVVESSAASPAHTADATPFTSKPTQSHAVACESPHNNPMGAALPYSLTLRKASTTTLSEKILAPFCQGHPFGTGFTPKGYSQHRGRCPRLFTFVPFRDSSIVEALGITTGRVRECRRRRRQIRIGRGEAPTKNRNANVNPERVQ